MPKPIPQCQDITVQQYNRFASTDNNYWVEETDPPLLNTVSIETMKQQVSFSPSFSPEKG